MTLEMASDIIQTLRQNKNHGADEMFGILVEYMGLSLEQTEFFAQLCGIEINQDSSPIDGETDI